LWQKRPMNSSWMPTSKVTAGGAAGLVASVIISELHNRLGITLDGDEASLLTLVVALAAAYVTPHIPPPPPTSVVANAGD
jgi:hypothetical protein